MRYQLKPIRIYMSALMVTKICAVIVMLYQGTEILFVISIFH